VVLHNLLYSKGYTFHERFIKDLFNSLWTTRNSRWTTLRITALHQLTCFVRAFFVAVCDVPAPEEKYNMDEYSDAVLLVKPVIFITVKEMLDTHKV